MNRSRPSFSAAAAMATLALVASGARAASFIPLGALDGHEYSVPLAISADGSTVVGTSHSASGSGRAFIWDQVRGIRPIFDPESDAGSAALDVSADGSTVVGILDGRRVFWDEAGGARSIDLGFSPALMSADGSTFVGRSGGATVVWDAVNGIRDLGNLPGGDAPDAVRISADGSTIIGSDITDLGQEAFAWTAETGIRSLGVLPGGGDSFASAAIGVSADGSKVVGGSSSAYGQEAFIWDAASGIMTGLGDLPPVGWESFLSLATDVSGDGSIAVGVGSSGTFVWEAEGGMRDLDVLLTTLGLDLGGWTLHQVVYGDEMPRISADGRTIVGTGYDRGRRTAYIAVIPEPSTALLLGVGLVALLAPRHLSRG